MAAATPAYSVTIDDLIGAKKLVKVGSVEAAPAGLSALAKLSYDQKVSFETRKTSAHCSANVKNSGCLLAQIGLAFNR